MTCRGEIAARVKGIVGGMWSVGSKSLRGSRGQSAECGLSAGVVCRDKYGEWVKRLVGGVWSVGAKSLSGSRGQSLACGLSGRNR